MRESFCFDVIDEKVFKQQIILFSKNYNSSAIFDSCEYYSSHLSSSSYHVYEFIAGFDALKFINPELEEVNSNFSNSKDWLFGYLSYDLKNKIEALHSENIDKLTFPELYFFKPRFVIAQKKGEWFVEFIPEHDSTDTAKQFIHKIKEINIQNTAIQPISFTARVSKNEYIKAVNNILSHIHKGDIYELNYCMEFFAENQIIDPTIIFGSLQEVSPTPFSVFFNLGNHFIMSASPERYITKQGHKLISQPIKGTIKRGANETEDLLNKNKLFSDEKERSENIMIADLVRNDLSKVAKRGSVTVEELCGIYTFSQVFQMITTVVSELDYNISLADILKASFPMGSMTGAPKIRAMELIEQYESTKRGVYSGAVGYITPNGDFDFNVVIRSLLYNQNNKYLSYMVGSAITEKSIAENEYDECLLKAKGILQVFNSNNLH